MVVRTSGACSSVGSSLITSAMRTFTFLPDVCHRCQSPFPPTCPQSWICPRCEAVMKAFPIRPDFSNECLGRWGSVPEVARRQIMSYLVLDYTLLYRLHFLQRSLLAWGSEFHKFTDRRGGCTSVPCEDIFGRILSYLSPPQKPPPRSAVQVGTHVWSWAERAPCMRHWPIWLMGGSGSCTAVATAVAVHGSRHRSRHSRRSRHRSRIRHR